MNASVCELRMALGVVLLQPDAKLDAGLAARDLVAWLPQAEKRRHWDWATRTAHHWNWTFSHKNPSTAPLLPPCACGGTFYCMCVPRCCAYYEVQSPKDDTWDSSSFLNALLYNWQLRISTTFQFQMRFEILLNQKNERCLNIMN